MGDSDIPYAYDLMQRTVQSVTVDGTPLASLLLDEEHNLWHRFVQWAFFDDYTRFSVTKRFADVAERYRVTERTIIPLGTFVFGFFAALFSVLALPVLFWGTPRVLIYCVDKDMTRFKTDPRLERIYATLDAARVPYTEVFHTIIGRLFLRRFFIRRRPVIYLEGIEWAYFVGRMVRRLLLGRKLITIGGLETFSEEEQYIVRATVSKFVSVAPMFRLRRRVLRWIIQHSRIRAIFSIDDARHYQELVAAAKDCSVPSYAFQHGQLTPYFLGWFSNPLYRGTYFRSDYFVTWSEYWKQELLALGGVWPAENIIVGGSPKTVLKTVDIRRATVDDPPTILIPYEIDAPVSVIKEFIARAREAGYGVIFKIRADMPRQRQLLAYAFAPGDVDVIVNLSELTRPITAVIGTYSTFLYDAVETLVPVGLLDSALLHSKRMLVNDVANRVSLERVAEDLAMLSALSESVLKTRKERVAVHDVISETVTGILHSVKLL